MSLTISLAHDHESTAVIARNTPWKARALSLTFFRTSLFTPQGAIRGDQEESRSEEARSEEKARSEEEGQEVNPEVS
jgi:hypothetical protein